MERYQVIIQKVADTHGINPDWLNAIIQTESGWDIWASRFESGYQWLYKPEAHAKLCRITVQTEIAAQKTSYGLGQIMGALAREQGHIEALGKLFLPEINIEHIGIRLKWLKRRPEAAGSSDAIFAGYNGGPGSMKRIGGVYPNQVYVDKINLALKLK